jgi:hypothetical protein
MASREVTEGRLRAALQRLLDGKPERIKKAGKLSLNRINNEAGLGHSYIHKFENFVRDEANPAIKEFNENYDPLAAKLALGTQYEFTPDEKLRAKLKKEISLKEQYRKERDEAIQINNMLEQKNSTLMFRVYELQEDVRRDNIVSFSKNKQDQN